MNLSNCRRFYSWCFCYLSDGSVFCCCCFFSLMKAFTCISMSLHCKLRVPMIVLSLNVDVNVNSTFRLNTRLFISLMGHDVMKKQAINGHKITYQSDVQLHLSLWNCNIIVKLHELKLKVYNLITYWLHQLKSIVVAYISYIINLELQKKYRGQGLGVIKTTIIMSIKGHLTRNKCIYIKITWHFTNTLFNLI